MKKIRLQLILYACLLFITVAHSQTAIQQDTVIDNGPADTLGNVQILQNSDGKLIIAGNRSINATQCNFQTLCTDTAGILTWSQMFNANLQKAYTTAATHDSNGNVIVVGCTYIDTTNQQDLTILKYDHSGNLTWSKYYNGGFNDVASDVVVDTADYIYVTGSKGGNFPNFSDYVTLKLSPSGHFLDTMIYNYGNLADIPMGISYDHLTHNIIVSGTSGSGFTNFDLATVRYSASSGTQLLVDRHASSAPAQNLESDMVGDVLGNVYYTGRMWNGSNFDIRVVKLNDSLQLQWAVSYDGYGLEDGGTKIQLDNSGHVIVTGFMTKAGSGLHEAVVLKYAASTGALIWDFPKSKYSANYLYDVSEGLDIEVDAADNIYIGGNATKNGSQDAFLLKLDANGNGKYYEAYNGGDIDQYFDMLVDDGTIFVTARSVTGSGLRNILVKYEERDLTPMFTNTSPSYAARELIVSFNPAVLKMNAINDRKFKFGKLSDFIQDSICDKIDSKFSDAKHQYHSANFNAHKIFYTMTERDSLSITRLGDTIKVPKFYSTIVVNIPTLAAPLTLQGASDSLETIKPGILYSEFNLAFKLCSPPYGGIVPDDPLWSDQAGLHPTTAYPSAHINVDSCWAVAHGEPTVKIGIFDTGIQTSHIDLTGLSTGGANFADPSLPFGNFDPNGHGTEMAGIIAGTRNNTWGGAGIAGRNDSLQTQGVGIWDCKVTTFDTGGGDSLVPLDKIAFAMHHAVRGDSSGFAINIANQSLASTSYPQLDSLLKNKTFQDQLIFACRNGVAVASSKANIELALPCFPADWNPEIMTCVGGSGNNGHRAYKVTGGNPAVNNCQKSTSYGFNIDFVAPASYSLVETSTIGNNYDFQPSGYSSGACAHVVGAYGLMMSYFNQPGTPWEHLLHEDCENILRRTATDLNNTVDYNEQPGWDRYSGWGRINVYRAIREINKYHYRFRHINTAHATAYSTNSTFILTDNNVVWQSYQDVPNGIHATDLYEMKTTLSYSLNPGETIKDAWPMYKECQGWSNDLLHLSMDKPYYAKIDTFTNSYAILTTYYMYNQVTGHYYPDSPANIKSAITLYTYDTANTGVGIKENIEPNTNYRIRPNPNGGQFNITFGSEVDTDMRYKVFDMLGREVGGGNYTSHFGENNISVNISHLTSGLYIVNVFDKQSNKVLYKQKVIKD